MGFLLFLAAGALLAGFDCYLSWSRLKTYGPIVELNPVARQLARDFGIKSASVFLVLQNAAILTAIDHYRAETYLHVLVGAKLGLAALQLKSLQIEHFVEKLLSRKK